MPVFGYDTAGQSQTDAYNFMKGNYDTTDGIGGSIQKFHCSIGSVDGSLKGFKIGVVNTIDGDPSEQTVVEQVEFDGEVTSDFEVVAPEGNSLNPSTDYYLGFTGEHGSNRIKYDTGFYFNNYYRALISPYADQIVSPVLFGFQYSAMNIFSIWIDYEVEEEGAVLPVLSGDSIHSAEDLIVR